MGRSGPLAVSRGNAAEGVAASAAGQSAHQLQDSQGGLGSLLNTEIPGIPISIKV